MASAPDNDLVARIKKESAPSNPPATVARQDQASLRAASLREQAEIKRIDVEREGLQKYYLLRTHWSWFAFFLLLIMILFQGWIVVGVGLKWFDFSKYDSLIKLVVGENFLQIVGISLIVVKFLFPNTPMPDGKNTGGKTPGSRKSGTTRPKLRRAPPA